MGNLQQIGNCPNCGAPLTADISNGGIVCQYCKSVIAISVAPAVDSNNPGVNASVDNLGQGIRFLLRTVQPELTYQANFNENSFNSQGGHLWITKDEVVFKPHSFNFGNLDKKYIRIQDVAGYTKGFLTSFSIWTKDGSEMSLVVWKKNEIIREVEKRRHAFYQAHGLPTPPLQFGNVSV